MNLHEVEYVGKKDEVLLLLRKGADINTQEGEHRNALQGAMSKGHPGVVSSPPEESTSWK
jgi:ankyrin repeat protein